VSHREDKIIHAVACPVCAAPIGSGCQLRTPAVHATARGRLLVHGQRRAAWQVWRRTHPPDVFIGNLGSGRLLLVPQSEAARQWIERRHPDVPRSDDGYVVSDRALIDALVAAGWHVE
jgi:hypothetical protein